MVVPAAVMTPYAYSTMMRLVKIPASKVLHHLSLLGVYKFFAIWTGTYAIAMTMRDACFWPIVKKVYLQLHDPKTRR